MEIGSFIELQLPKGQEYFRGTADIARLNSGRAGIFHAARCLACHTVWLPRYLCSSVRDFLTIKGLKCRFYDINERFEPVLSDIPEEDAIVLTNFFGIMSHDRMLRMSQRFNKVILDNAQAFFAPAIPFCMSVYSARKFIGAPDGAYVLGKEANRFTDNYEQDYSSDTSLFLLLRIEYGCEGRAYVSRGANEARIDQSDVKQMSGLTRCILDGTDYDFIKRKRRENFITARKLLDKYNQLKVDAFISSDCVPMVYPLLTDHAQLTDVLISRKHFQGRWWSYLSDQTAEGSFEYRLSRCLVPITIDQRYGEPELVTLADTIRQCLGDTK